MKKLLLITFVILTDYPTEYNVSVVIKGTQLNQNDFGTFIINADGSFDQRW